MEKVCIISRFLTDANIKEIQDACHKAGYEAAFFTDYDEAARGAADAVIVYCSRPDALRAMPRLRWCHSANAGIEAFLRTGIFDSGEVLLTNSSGAYGRAISEYVIMAALMLVKRMPRYREVIDERGWTHSLPIRSVAGSRVVVAGTGDLGSSIAERFRALGASSIIGFNRSGREAGGFDRTFSVSHIDEYLPHTDILVLCMPGTPDTEGLLDAGRIALLPESAYVINVGRGSAIDQDALIEALNEGRLAGAALDVVYPEPLPADHPLWTARNCIVTPHMSGDMGLQYTIDKTVEIFITNLKKYAAGKDLANRVSVKNGY